MTEIYRRISPKKARLRDYLLVNGNMESISSISIYPPMERSPDQERPPLCPIREDWWAVAIHTASGVTQWLSEPDVPGAP